MMKNWKRTKIIATIGPASRNKRVLSAMIHAGADIFRINGAHGTFDEHKKAIDLIRTVAKQKNTSIGILLDLPGPKFRIGTLKKEPLRLKIGDRVTLVCNQARQSDARIPIPHKEIHRALKIGGKIFINDGIVELRVNKVVGKEVFCTVKTPGEISSHKGINLPNAKLKIPSLTAQDKKILAFAIRQDVDYIALSFVRSAKDILALRKILDRRAPHIGVVAKIEKPEALDDLNHIIQVSDAIMVARGDLGIEMPFNRIPLIQRMILNKCMAAGKPSITATQMLESMISAEKPTRAEATDVAGAVWEGSDAVMLSAETSVGISPPAAVNAMMQIALEAEKEMPRFVNPKFASDDNALQAQVLCYAASFIAESLNAKAIVTPTRSGRTPLFVSRARPKIPILALAENEHVARRMSLYWGVYPIAMPKFSTVDELLLYAERLALKSGFIKKGEKIVITSGAHGRKNDITKLIEVRQV